MLDEPVDAGTVITQLVAVPHADQIGGDQPSTPLEMREHIAPQVRRRGIAMQEDDGSPIASFGIGHPTIADGDAASFQLTPHTFGGHSGKASVEERIEGPQAKATASAPVQPTRT